MNKDTIKFNINHYVKVKLTDRGRDILQEQYYEMMNRMFPDTKLDYKPIKEDKNGWSKWQLWYLMSTFGEQIGMGLDTPFETNIRILVEE